ncbi:hypothetical protein BpHYR1_008983 [Brachionus plicatilis]|uniref:Uncharacterized protein n=1 Tax=Brachionus plicatilis TaxID=10195 RepID=A0A3M7RL44_BRAPC|nr:hypothetical protein BpHYR1_008983 [Brachionus plicatilis]
MSNKRMRTSVASILGENSRMDEFLQENYNDSNLQTQVSDVQPTQSNKIFQMKVFMLRKHLRGIRIFKGLKRFSSRKLAYYKKIMLLSKCCNTSAKTNLDYHLENMKSLKKEINILTVIKSNIFANINGIKRTKISLSGIDV